MTDRPQQHIDRLPPADNDRDRLTRLEIELRHLERTSEHNTWALRDLVVSKVDQVEKALTTKISEERFKPVELIAYGLAGGVLLTVLGLFMGQIIIQ